MQSLADKPDVYSLQLPILWVQVVYSMKATLLGLTIKHPVTSTSVQISHDNFTNSNLNNFNLVYENSAMIKSASLQIGK